MTETPFLSLDIPSALETQDFGAKLADLLRPGDVVALHGSLGMGKSTLARAVIQKRSNNGDLEVPSPTFTIVQTYDLDPPIYHVDLYRLDDADEAMELGLEDSFDEAISLIEWPERLGPYLPKKALIITMTESKSGGRRFDFSGPAFWKERFDA